MSAVSPDILLHLGLHSKQRIKLYIYMYIRIISRKTYSGDIVFGKFNEI